jgi:2-keto-4-pentenoate hydratase/2-oxohepta-3-ene-1,7-dioic acid hydratase in catechol pathway
MKFIRFKTEKVERKGILEDGKIKEVIGSFFSDYIVTENIFVLDEVKVLPPILPSKIVCIGRNYAAHAKELGNEIPEAPLMFLKPSTAVIGHNDSIIYPNSSNHVDHEAELAVVIKRTCKKVSENEALDYVLGYTCLNDVTARDIQKKENKFTRGKGFDTFAPMGPVIETELNPFDVNVRAYVNGEIKQNGNTKNMMFNVAKLISFISNVMTLLPGDVIATGTPEGVGRLEVGDIVEIEVEGIGKLSNRVEKEK